VGGLTPAPSRVFLAAPMLKPQRSIQTVLLAMLLLGACRCDDKPPPVRKAERRELKDEELLAQLPKIEGAPIDPALLAETLPAVLDEAKAEGEAQTESTPLANNGSLSIARRTYVQGETRITVQITDMMHAPLLRQTMISAKANAERGKTSSWTPAEVQGRDAVAQRFAEQNAAIANVAATDRVFVNVRVEPAETAELALQWAEKLPLDPITKLVPTTDPQPAEPKQPPPL